MKFVDTNVLLYAISRDPAEERKAAIAREILDGDDVGLSVQVLQEFYVQATRETRPDRLRQAQAVGLVESFTRFHVQDLTLTIVRAAMQSRDRFGLSYWDSAIIEAARALGCAELISEDLGDGRDYDGVVVTNPFR